MQIAHLSDVAYCCLMLELVHQYTHIIQYSILSQCRLAVMWSNYDACQGVEYIL